MTNHALPDWRSRIDPASDPPTLRQSGRPVSEVLRALALAGRLKQSTQPPPEGTTEDARACLASAAEWFSPKRATALPEEPPAESPPPPPQEHDPDATL